MVNVEYRIARRRDQVQRRRRRDLEEAVRLEEEAEDVHERVVVPPGDVQRVRGAADETRAVREGGEVLAHVQRDLVEGGHADVYADMRLSEKVRGV